MTPKPTNDPSPTPEIAESTDRRRRVPDTNPVRRCVATGQSRPQSEMIRFVAGPGDELFPDILARLPGRGVWVSADRDSVKLAIKKGGFQRGLKMKVRVPEGLPDTVETLLVKRCQDLIGLARKGSAAVLGADKVLSEVERFPPGWLLEASDGAGDGRGKVISRVRTLYGNGEMRLAGALSSAELGMAFGREHVVHALIKRGRFAKLWAGDYLRLIGFRNAPETNWLSGRQR